MRNHLLKVLPNFPRIIIVIAVATLGIAQADSLDASESISAEPVGVRTVNSNTKIREKMKNTVTEQIVTEATDTGESHINEGDSRKGNTRLNENSDDLIANMDFIYVNSGCYQMGDTFDDTPYSDQVHEVCVDAFLIGANEVTQGQWRAVMGDNPSFFASCGDNCPVEQVNWDDVQVFLKKLNERVVTDGIRHGLKPAGRYRLPTEAEWEYAAREGGKKVRFGTGTDIISSDIANIHPGSGQMRPSYYKPGTYWGKTLPVGSFKPNKLGLYDMAGNVWEWCSDWSDLNYYNNSPRDNPQGPSLPRFNARVMRGGSWHEVLWSARAAGHAGLDPRLRKNDIGFRLVRSL